MFLFIEILFKMLLFKGGVLIYAEHCVCVYMYMYIYVYIYMYMYNSRANTVVGNLFILWFLVLPHLQTRFMVAQSDRFFIEAGNGVATRF